MRTVSVLTGLDVALRDGLSLPGKGRAAVLCNSTTVASSWVPTTLALARIPGVLLERILSPQHGFAAEKQDNMVASADGVHPRLGIPIVSLYGERRERGEDLAGIDALIIDLPMSARALHVPRLGGARSASRTAVRRRRRHPGPAESDRRRDRGPGSPPGFESFVGNLDIPLRHGLTLGEGCLYGAWRAGLIQPPAVAHGHDFGWLRVVRLAGWTRISTSTRRRFPGRCLAQHARALDGDRLPRAGHARGDEPLRRPRDDAALRDLRRALAGSRSRSAGTRRPGLGAGRGRHSARRMLLREVAYEPTFQRYKGNWRADSRSTSSTATPTAPCTPPSPCSTRSGIRTRSSLAAAAV